MTTGYSAAGGCWATANEAIDAYYSAISTPVFISGSNFIKVQYLKDAGVWKLYGWATPNLAAWGTPAVTVPNTNVYGTCTLETSPGYPQQLTSTGGTSSGGTTTTTGTVTLTYPPVTYDYATATAAWSFAFVTVMGIWWTAKNIGIVMNAIRRW